MRYQLLLCLAVVSGALLLPGCGHATGDVAGFVKYNGKPAAGSTITFFDERKGVPSCVIGEDGSYTVKNVAAGISKISVVSPIPVVMRGTTASKAMTVPAKYHHSEGSGLTYTIKSGAQTHNIDLTD